MQDENADLRNAIMDKFQLVTPVLADGDAQHSAKMEGVPTSVGEGRIDSPQALALHEEQIRKVQEESEMPEKKDSKESLQEKVSGDSLELLSQVLEKKQEGDKEVEKIRERANKVCIDPDVMGYMFGL